MTFIFTFLGVKLVCYTAIANTYCIDSSGSEDKGIGKWFQLEEEIKLNKIDVTHL